MSEGFTRDGFAIVPDVLEPERCAQLVERLESSAGVGSRRLLDDPEVRAVAGELLAHPVLAPLFGSAMHPAQCTLFAKTPALNWSVTPHQDLSIPVATRVEAAECSGWSVKEGVTYVQPPPEVLNALVAVRVQLDPRADESGPLEVVPGTHHARLDAEGLREARRCTEPVRCIVPLGGALVMRPLLVHASAKAIAQAPRRVLHFLFGPRELPFGLRWPDVSPPAGLRSNQERIPT